MWEILDNILKETLSIVVYRCHFPFSVSFTDVRQPFCDHDHTKMEKAWVLSFDIAGWPSSDFLFVSPSQSA